MHQMHRIFIGVLLLAAAGTASAQQLVFASASEGRRVLSTKDDYLLGMSPFDRSARMKTDQAVTLQAFIEFSSSSAVDWEQAEKQRVDVAYRQIQPTIARLALPLPDRVYLVKTTGHEEGHAAYTRGSAIFLPRRMLNTLSDIELQRLLAHELFHVSTRHSPQLARSLYQVIGFEYCGKVNYPAELAPRKISNPDAPRNDYCINLKLGHENVLATPVLFSRALRYDVEAGGDFFDYLQLGLLLVKKSGDGKPAQVMYDARGPRLVAINQVSGFFEKVGHNTQYIIHPEEILADNFSMLVMGERDLPSPHVLERMQQVFETAASQ